MTPPARTPKPLASSPFKPRPEPVVELFDVEDLVSHDAYGMGRVLKVDAYAVTVDFRNQTVRVTTPCTRMSKL